MISIFLWFGQVLRCRRFGSFRSAALFFCEFLKPALRLFVPLKSFGLFSTRRQPHFLLRDALSLIECNQPLTFFRRAFASSGKDFSLRDMAIVRLSFFVLVVRCRIRILPIWWWCLGCFPTRKGVPTNWLFLWLLVEIFLFPPLIRRGQDCSRFEAAVLTPFPLGGNTNQHSQAGFTFVRDFENSNWFSVYFPNCSFFFLLETYSEKGIFEPTRSLHRRGDSQRSLFSSFSSRSFPNNPWRKTWNPLSSVLTRSSTSDIFQSSLVSFLSSHHMLTSKRPFATPFSVISAQLAGLAVFYPP